MFDNPFNLGLFVVMVAGISGAIISALLLKFLAKRDKRHSV